MADRVRNLGATNIESRESLPFRVYNDESIAQYQETEIVSS